MMKIQITSPEILTGKLIDWNESYAVFPYTMTVLQNNCKWNVSDECGKQGEASQFVSKTCCKLCAKVRANKAGHKYYEKHAAKLRTKANSKYHDKHPKPAVLVAGDEVLSETTDAQ